MWKCIKQDLTQETTQFLGASTDGIVLEKDKTKTTKGLLEIKNVLETNCHLIKDAVNKVPQFCLEIVSNKHLTKRNHPIYFQGQLNIFKTDWCDFVLRRTKPYDIFIERILKDEHL